MLSPKESSLSSEDALLSSKLKMPGKSSHVSETQSDTYITDDPPAASNFEEKPKVETVPSDFVEDVVKDDCSPKLELSASRRVQEFCIIEGFRSSIPRLVDPPTSDLLFEKGRRGRRRRRKAKGIGEYDDIYRTSRII